MAVEVDNNKSLSKPILGLQIHQLKAEEFRKLHQAKARLVRQEFCLKTLRPLDKETITF